MSKETYYSVKRDLLQCQKRPATVSKETCYSVKRDLLACMGHVLQKCVSLLFCVTGVCMCLFGLRLYLKGGGTVMKAYAEEDTCMSYEDVHPLIVLEVR